MIERVTLLKIITHALKSLFVPAVQLTFKHHQRPILLPSKFKKLTNAAGAITIEGRDTNNEFTTHIDDRFSEICCSMKSNKDYCCSFTLRKYIFQNGWEQKGVKFWNYHTCTVQFATFWKHLHFTLTKFSRQIYF